MRTIKRLFGAFILGLGLILTVGFVFGSKTTLITTQAADLEAIPLSFQQNQNTPPLHIPAQLIPVPGGLTITNRAWPGQNNPDLPLELTKSDKPNAASLQTALLQLPLQFIPNHGQSNSDVRFQVKSAVGNIFFTPNEVIFSLPASPERGQLETETSPSVIRLTFAGANLTPTLAGLNALPGVANFFIGNDPARWQSNLPTYEALVYKGLYPGIDLVYRGTAGQLKSEFMVAPGANPDLIRLRYDGVEDVQLRADGALVLRTTAGELVEAPLLIYQEINGRRHPIQGRYVILAKAERQNDKAVTVALDIASYEPRYPLVIDPELSFSTYLGGNSQDYGYDIAVDNTGNVYIIGGTSSSDFPTYRAIQDYHVEDAFITKIISVSGIYTFGYSTYLGGSSVEQDFAIAVDSTGNVYVMGETWSDDFPIYRAIQDYNKGNGDIFVTKIISASGVYTFGYSTYLGGSNSEGLFGLPGEVICDIAVDSAGNAYVTGNTESNDFPTHQAIQNNLNGPSDAFVTKIISASGVYTFGYSTYLGGSSNECIGQKSCAIAIDSVGNAYVAGSTWSNDFPTHQAFQNTLNGSPDAFVTKIISVSGVYTFGYSTYLGGNSGECALACDIAVDKVGNVYVMGETWSDNFPTYQPIQDYHKGNGDVFVTKIMSVSGVYTFGYSTYLGGSSYECGGACDIAVDSMGNAYIAGSTASNDFPTHQAFQNTLNGPSDAFVTKIMSVSGVYTFGYSTYLGGSNGECGVGCPIAADSVGNTYVAGSTTSDDFPTHQAIQSSPGDSDPYAADTFVAIISELTNALNLPIILK